MNMLSILINKMKKLLYLLSLILIILSCRKEDVYELNEVQLHLTILNKINLKSSNQFISILYKFVSRAISKK